MSSERRPSKSSSPSSTRTVYIDLDKFKSINDERGHGAGDELLKTIAERLKGAARRSDCVGRVGGDEFIVSCPGVETDEDARLASRDCALTADQVIAQADAAMYASKRGGGGRAILAQPAAARSCP